MKANQTYEKTSIASVRVKEVMRKHKKILALTLLAGILRLGRLGATDISPALRSDEGFTLNLIQHDFSRIVELTSQDVHPPLYYILARLWGLTVGMDVTRIRLLAVIFGTLSVPLLYLVAKRVASDRAALVATALLATTTFNIFQSQKARMYSLLLCLALCSTYYYLDILESGDRRSVVFYTLATAAMAYTHVFSVFVALFHAVDFAIRVWRDYHSQSIKRYLSAVVGIGVLSTPWLFVFAQQAGSKAGDFWIGSVTTYKLFWTAGVAYAGNYMIALLFAIAFAALAYSLATDDLTISSIQLPLLWMLVPILAPLAVSVLIAPIFVARYTLPALPGLYLLVGIGVSSRQDTIQATYYAILGILLTINLYLYYFESELGPWLV